MRTMKILMICLYAIGQLFITGSIEAQNGALEITTADSYTHIYSDRGTGADSDLSTWAPDLPSGFYAIGHLAKEGYDEPGNYASLMIVKGNVAGVIAYPTDYRLIWKDKGSGGNQDGAFWEPIAPAGYVALGTVVTASWSKPSLTAVVCVNADYVSEEKVDDLIWNDKGSGADADLSLWTLTSSDFKAAPGSFTGYASHSKPSSSSVAYSVKIIDLVGVDSYTHIYSDRGTGADQDLSTWAPNLPSGFYAIGHLAKKGYDKPTSEILAIKGVVTGAVVYPTDYRLVWKDKGSGGDQDGAFWEPVAPAGYVAMGTVVTASWSKPPLTAVVCVLEDLTVEASIGNLIWNDKGSGADADLSLWKLNANSHVHISSGSFCAYASHNIPNSSNVAFVIESY